MAPSGISLDEEEQKNLEQLFEAFGSAVSLKDIASAYCQAGRNVYTAAEILFDMQGSTSSNSTFTSKDGLEGASASSDLSSDSFLGKSREERNSTSTKPKKFSVSMGTVSGIIGREYARQRPSSNEPRGVTKPLKLNSSELPASEIWVEKMPPDIQARSETMHEDVEEFLFTMLGNGFGLNRNIIREVLGLCGYDPGMSMKKLMVLSASSLEKSDNVSSVVAQTISSKQPMEKSLNERYELQKEVLESLFSAPERVEEEPKRIRPVRKKAFGQVVTEPLRDTPLTDRKIVTVKPKVTDDENEENDGSYEFLRKAVKEYWTTMKDYYEAAVDAFAKGDHARAYKLLEEGHFFMNKAREAEEKSASKLVETRDDAEEMSIDLCEYEPKEAIRLLKFHLTSLCGIPSIQYLKLIIGTSDNDAKEAARKRMILKLLERGSITWTEEGNGQLIVIRVDEINPKRLSFVKK